MAKYSFDFKLQVIQFYLDNHGYQATARYFNLECTTVRKWVKAYQYHGAEGIKPRTSKLNYTAEFKLHVVTYMALNNLSIRETAAYFNIPAFTSVLEWKSLFKMGGLDALKPRQKGRPNIMKRPKKPDNRTEQEKLIDELTAELLYLRAENDVLKKYQELEEREEQRRLKPETIEELKEKHPLTLLLKVTHLARSSYYYHRKSLFSADPESDLKAKILSIYHENKGRYGYRRITAILRREFIINHKKVQRLMKQLNLKSLIRPKKYRSYKGQIGRVAKNLLQRQFTASKPNQKWVTDVTEFKVNGEKLYLSPILDLYNQEVISYEITKRPKYELVERMLEKALTYLQSSKRGREKLILHSDQGWQYQMAQYQQNLKKNNIKQSMSRKGNCYDNAVIENFFGILKSEFFYTQRFESVDHLQTELHKYIDYYNHKRIKLKLKGLSPIEYRTQSLSL
ncbi:IS3 family transposase [Ignatzschineria rhizosphaerae]|uniref:IS3 family transposase n=1 Tax=Ignatzschineria rhizosphaerae TaxID=2923279 RepID=A0ABY3WZV3_9GAMM|nr:IS3 family transposase [Ignatzschineria rhizosphaerae]UNM96134.1 IS3 family transposase [Ignatzschineria rhizosphaerae]